jgi:hypothetical protein
MLLHSESEDQALERLKKAEKDIVIYEDELGYYLLDLPSSFKLARNIYDLVVVNSAIKGYVATDETMPILYRKGERYYLITICTCHQVTDFCPMINLNLIYV